MINARISLNATRNAGIKTLGRLPNERNSAWIDRAVGAAGDEAQILLAGGTSLTDFRLRVAQSHLRHDLLPSFWSHAAVLMPRPGGRERLWQVDLEFGVPLAEVPGTNGIAHVGLDRYDGERFQNLALLRFPGAKASAVLEGIGALQIGRLSEDLVSPLCRWLAYVLGAEGAQNPLSAGHPLPSAKFVDAVFAYAGVDIVPGVSSAAACPEAIWQAALWWSGYYAGDGQGQGQGGAVPVGSYWIAQSSAHVVE